MSRPSQISLVASYGPYVSVAGGTLVANQSSIGPNETFTLIDCGNNQVALQTSTGTYVTAENGGGDVLHVNRTAIGAWEKFTLVDLGYGRIALQAFNGQYVSADQTRAYNLVANRSAIVGWETFGIIDRTLPDVQASPPGSPLITTTYLNNDAQLLQYNPATGDLYRTGVNVFGFFEAPVLLNRENPCDRGCSLIVTASIGNSAYLITYRQSDGKASLHPLTHDGLGPPRSIGPWDRDFAQIISVTLGGTPLLLFYRMNGGPIASYLFDPSTSTALSFRRNIDGGNLDADWAQLVPVSMNNAQYLLGYRRTTGEAILWDLSASAISNYRVMAIFDRTWGQLTSFVDADGQMIFLRAGSSEMYFYQISASGLSDPKSATLPAMRPPTVRLHAVQSGQLVQVGQDGSIKLCADSNIDNFSKLELLPDDSGSFRLRSISNTLLCVDATAKVTTCADSIRTAASLFQMVSQAGARFRLRSASGSYLWVDAVQGLQVGSDDAIQQLGVFAQSLFEWNDYGIGGGSSYLDARLGQVATPPAFTSLVPVHSEYDSTANCFCFSARSANEAAAAGLQSRDTVFHAYGSQMAGTIPVYIEKSVSGQEYHLSTRDAQTAAQWGYKQLGIAFYAYATPQPGTVPIYRECPNGAVWSQYYFSTRSASDASAAGWQQMDVAFYAYAPLAPVHSEYSASEGAYYFSTRDASEAADAGFKAYDTVFCAYRSPVPGTIPVYIEKPVSGQGYHLSTRDAQTAAQWGYKQLGIAFYAYATPQPGTVPIYRECPNGAAWSQYYFSTRSASDASAAGWQQMDVAFYAYLPGPYLLARTQLVDAWLGDSAQTVPGYRVVLDCCTIAGQPVQTAITLSATAVTTLQLSDGSSIEVGPVRPITRSTSEGGQLSFVIETGGQLLTPVIKVKADFMGGSQVLAIAPDQNAHRALANLDPATLSTVVGNRAALIKQVMGVLASSAPLAIAPLATDISSVSRIVAFGIFDDIGHAIGNFFTHTIPSIAQDGAKAVSQAVQPIVQVGQKTAQTVVTALTAETNRVIAPGSPVMVVLQGAATQVQAVIAQGLAAAGQVASQIQAGVNVAIAFTTAIIKEAGTIGERAFQAFLIDVGTANKLLIASAHEAESFVIELVKQAGKALSDLLALVTARFNWDHILVTHNSINSCLSYVFDVVHNSVQANFASVKTSMVSAVRNMGAKFDGTFDTWLSSLPTPQSPGAPSVDPATEYFQSLMQRTMGDARVSFTPPAPASGDLATGFQQLISGLVPSGSSPLANQQPDALALFKSGLKPLFLTAKSLIDLVFGRVADFIEAHFDSLKDAFLAALDVAKQLINAPLAVPILSDLYERIIMKGNGIKLSISSLISLVAAVMLEGGHQAATGPSEPFLSPDDVSPFGRTQVLSFSASEPTPVQRRKLGLSVTTIRAVGALLQAIQKARAAKLVIFTDLVQDYAMQVGQYLIYGMDAIADKYIFSVEGPAVDFKLVIWYTGLSFILVGANGLALTVYPEVKALYGIVLFCMKMVLWAQQDSPDNPDPDNNPVDNGLEGGGAMIQAIIGLLALGDQGSDLPRRMLYRTGQSVGYVLLSLVMFGRVIEKAETLQKAG